MILRWLIVARLYLAAAVPVAALVVALWALVFGVTFAGRHYLFSCTDDRGVVIEAKP